MKDFAAIDFETANNQRSSVCSVGIVIVRDGEITDTFYSLINPEPNYYNYWCSQVHGLTRKDTDNAPVFPDVWRQIEPLIEGLPLVAHNRPFDEGCLKAVFRVYQMDYPCYEFYDTLSASRRALPGLPNHQLHTVAEACGYQLKNHHHALADAEACAWIAREIFINQEKILPLNHIIMSDTNKKELHLKAFSELKGKIFHIPYQQRGYKWTKSNVEELLNDLREFISCNKESKRVYCLQPLAIVPLGDERYSVIDGQQRLTTLYLLHMYLYGNEPYTFEYDRDDKCDDSNIPSRSEYLKNIASQDEKTADMNIDFFYIYTAYHYISEFFGDDKLKQSFRDLLERSKDQKSLQVIWYEVERARQYETFRNLNSGKIHLTNTDLIKALLLNRVSGLTQVERMEAAAIFERMERDLQNDHFWYMINGNELREGQTRMDFLFNLVAGCKQSDYDIDSRWSFRNYFNDSKKENLSQKWKAVRHTFLRLKDMYDDIYSYHYIGFLTYNSNRNPINNITRWLALNRELTHSEFINRLRSEIKTILTRKHKAITEYSYYSDKKDLRLLFLMHNIETILQRFEQLHEDERLCLDNEYEKFPFELLHRQSWDIEHISSNTDSDFRNSADRKAWLESIKQDLGNEYTKDENSKIKELEMIYSTSEKREDFNRLYTAIMRQYDDKTDSIKDNAPDGKDKMQIGNLTLLDSSTNRSYHNALFPRKRRYIIVADGISDKSDKFESSLTPRYIPPCTRQVFTKAYNKTNKLSLNAWTQEDADFYVKDMEQKLGYYFNNEKI